MTTDVQGGSEARRRFVAAGLVAVVLALLAFAPILYHMALTWRAVPDYSHGFLVAPLAVYFAWERRGQLQRCPIEPSWWGILPLALGSLALAVGRLGVELMAMRVAFVLTLHGLVLLLFGRRIYRTLLFPLLFLFLMVPLPQSLVNSITFPLQLIAADLAVGWLHALGLPALREGNIIHLPHTELFVAEACSGLRSLMALGTLAVVFAYFFRRNPIERVVIVASALPIAILVNAVRVALTGILTHRFGEEAAQGWIHQTQGFVTFGMALAVLMVEASLLQLIGSRTWRRRRRSA